MLALVVHREIEFKDALIHPAAPILQHLAIRARPLIAPRCALRTVSISDRRGTHANVRFESRAFQVYAPHKVRDLITTPLRPLWVGGRGDICATGGFLKARDSHWIVSPRGDECSQCKVRIPDAVKVDAIDIVIGDNTGKHPDDVISRVWMAGVKQIVAPSTESAIRPIHQPIIGTGLGWPMLVKHVIGIDRRSDAIPDRSGNHPGMYLDFLRVRLVDEILERIERLRRNGCLSAWHHCPIAETVAAPTHLDNKGIY